MGCSSNTNLSTSLLKMAKGSNFDNEAQWALQMTSLASKLKIKDTILKECLHICNQNFDKKKYYCCVQCSEDDWMVWIFYYDLSNLENNIAEMVPKFLNVYHVCLKRFLGIPFFRCDCLFYERWGMDPVSRKYEFLVFGNMNSSYLWIHMLNRMNDISHHTHIFLLLPVAD